MPTTVNRWPASEADHLTCPPQEIVIYRGGRYESPAAVNTIYRGGLFKLPTAVKKLIYRGGRFILLAAVKPIFCGGHIIRSATVKGRGPVGPARPDFCL